MIERIKYYIGRKVTECDIMRAFYPKEHYDYGYGFIDGYYWCLHDLLSEIKEIEIWEVKESE